MVVRLERSVDPLLRVFQEALSSTTYCVDTILEDLLMEVLGVIAVIVLAMLIAALW